VKWLVIIIVILYSGIIGFAQKPLTAQSLPGVPVLLNYTRQDFNTRNSTIYFITQAPNGILYFAHPYGVLEFDGAYWNLFETEFEVRNIHAENDLLLISGKNNIGAIELGNQKSFQPFKVPINSNALFFNQILYNKSITAFTSSDSLLYIIENNKINAIPFVGSIALVNNQIWAAPDDTTQPLSYINEQYKLTPLPDAQTYNLKNITNLAAIGKNQVLIVSNDKYFYYDGNQIQVLSSAFNKAVQSFVGNWVDVARLQSGNWVFLSRDNEVVIITSQGQVLYQLNSQNALPSPTIYSIFVDRENILWISHVLGLTRLMPDLPLTALHILPGFPAGTYTGIALFKDHLYYSGFSSAARLNIKNPTSFEPYGLSDDLIPNNFRVFRNRLIYTIDNQGIFDGTHGFTNKPLLPLKSKNPISVFRSYADTNRFYVAQSDSLYIIHFKDSVWRPVERLKHSGGITLFGVEEANNRLLLETEQGIIRILLTTANQKLNIDTLNSQFIDLNNQPLSLADELFNKKIFLFSPRLRLFELDEKNGIARYTRFDSLYNSKNGLIYFGKEGKIWVRNDDILELITPDTNGNYHPNGLPIGNLMRQYGTGAVHEEYKHVFLMGINLLFWLDLNKFQLPQTPFQVLIRTCKATNDSAARTIQHDTLLHFDFENNSLEFTLAAPSFINEKRNFYRYQLETNNQKTSWSQWQLEKKVSFMNLPEGQYTLTVEAKNGLNQLSLPAEITFRIYPPWYRHPIAYAGYILLAFLSVWTLIRLNIRRLKLQQAYLSQQIALRTAEVEAQKKQLEIQANELRQANKLIMAQKEETEAQRDQLEETYANVRMLSSIGQTIAARLSIEEISITVYQRVNELMDAAIFIIGLYSPHLQRISFRGGIENGNILPPFVHQMNETNRLSVWCVKNQKEVFINDLANEYHHFVDQYPTATSGETPKSVIYLPLVTIDDLTGEPRTYGVLSVQSFQQHAYTDYHLDLLRNLAVYTVIALKNAEAYEAITEKNQHITDSIQYARRIQLALLPRDEELITYLPKHFVFYRPRDVVSGDFYWMANHSQNDRYTILAVGDCTGHGVPGAFMSMIGCSLLDEIVIVLGYVYPNQILNHLHVSIQRALHQSEGNSQDGMDIAVLVYDRQLHKIMFAGANNPLVYVQNQHLYIAPADKKSVGGTLIEARKFSMHEISLLDSTGNFIPTTCYLFTDGFQDQFGGKNKRKYMVKPFYQLLHKLSSLPIEKQRNAIQEELTNWMADYQQIDDILVIGIHFHE
jgi:serine phosphatase RsbU (regulator of sigma subunit)